MNFVPFNFNVFQGGEYQPCRPSQSARTGDCWQFNGRYQVGESVLFEFKTVGAGDYATTGAVKPDAVPVVRIYRSGLTARGFSLPIDRTSLNSVGLFAGSFALGHLDSAGHYYALVSYSVSGSPKASLCFFETLVGGHRHGPILSTFCVLQPSGSVFVAHEESGVISQGLRPYLDTGD